MDLQYYISRIKFQLTGDILDSELDDSAYAKVLQDTLVEMNRYYDATRLIEAPGDSCIDLKKLEEENNIKISSISNIYRTRPNGSSSGAESTGFSDPMLVSAWNMGNNMYRYGMDRWTYNYMSYNTAQQMANTLSTDLSFKEDKYDRKLYVSYSNGNPTKITIEYIPSLTSVEEVVGDYWIDILSRMALAYAKIALGRVRTRYTQSDALWEQDGATLLEEGTTELNAIRERLITKSNYFYPVD